MSAYIVTDKTITAICEGLYEFNIGIQRPKGRMVPREDFTEEDGAHDGYFAWLNELHKDDIRSTRTGEGFAAAGQALVDMNYMSVNARYGEDTEPHRFKATYNQTRYEDGPLAGMSFRREYNYAEILGAIRCYAYQSCECDEYERSGIPAALHLLTMEIAQSLARERFGDNDGRGYWNLD